MRVAADAAAVELAPAAEEEGAVAGRCVGFAAAVAGRAEALAEAEGEVEEAVLEAWVGFIGEVEVSLR